MKIDGVFSGGGVKAFAYIGALEAIEKRKFEFVRLAGSSAGAMVAGLVAAGYRSSELKAIMLDLDLKQFLDGSKMEKYFPFLKWLSLYKTFGLYNGKVLEEWLGKLLAQKGIYTFGQLKSHQLKLTVADLTLGRLIIIPDDLKQIYGLSPEQFSVARAIRMSASLPYFFKPKKLYDQEVRKHLIVDGALLSSLPIWLFKKPNQKLERPVLGFQLQSKEQYLTNPQINNGLAYTKTLIITMQHALDLKYISKLNQPNIVFLNADHINIADFSLTKATREELIKIGEEKTSDFLQKQFR
ncbi:patatin-like phospholipase family protein [Amphibacillus cookii]|uniref:patatin-like phospholipase family protein n=1 Tax=Amphibacillus cookii TaxID=767787 RepID=UPI00195ACD6C|nr:patatin-like phospholipase family protein [Amphibacillus cookii]MBM7542422.1 NTE family protein [Amphibacillus cookii]